MPVDVLYQSVQGLISMKRISHAALFPLNRQHTHGQTAATLSSMEKKAKKQKNESRWELSLDSFSNGTEMLMAERHACISTCACVCCVCVQGFLISFPIHMCHVSIWTLISDHMSGKSARVTEYRHRQ